MPGCCLCFERPVLFRALHAYSNSCHLERGGDETNWSYVAFNHEGNKLCKDQKNSTSSKRYKIWEDVNQMRLRKDVDKPSSYEVFDLKSTENIVIRCHNEECLKYIYSTNWFHKQGKNPGIITVSEKQTWGPQLLPALLMMGRTDTWHACIALRPISCPSLCQLFDQVWR